MNLQNSMRAFVEVAKEGGLAKAAKKMKISAPSITRLIGDFEAWAGAPLLVRTTRHVSLTEMGEAFLPRCIDILDNTQSLKTFAESSTESLSGTLRVTGARVLVRSVIAPLLPAFLAAYPRLKVHLDTTDMLVNVVSEHFDLAIRVGDLQDSTLVAKKLGQSRLVLTASPEFLARRGTPQSIADLKNFPCLTDTIPQFGSAWPIGGNKSRLEGPASVSDGEIVRDLTIASQGLSLLPKFVVQKSLDSGALVQVLADEKTPDLPIYAILPPKPYVSQSARALAETIAQSL